MKLPPVYRVLLRILIALLVVLLTFSWALRNPKTVDMLKGILAPSFTARPETWVLELRQVYMLCGHLETNTNRFPSEAVLKDTIQKHSDYHLAQISNSHFLYITQKKDYCSSCRNNRFLGLLHQEVVVFRGTPSQPGPVEEKVAIKFNLLPEAEIVDLKKGIPFRDPREKLQLIEGLNGLITE